MAIDIITQDLIPVRRDGQIASVSIGGGGGGASGTISPGGLDGVTDEHLYYENEILYTSGLTVNGDQIIASGHILSLSGAVGYSGGTPLMAYTWIRGNGLQITSGGYSTTLQGAGGIGLFNDYDSTFISINEYISEGDTQQMVLFSTTGSTMSGIGMLNYGNPIDGGPSIKVYERVLTSIMYDIYSPRPHTVIGFQAGNAYTDGTVTMFTPVDFKSGLTVTNGTVVLQDTVWDDLRVVPTAFDFVGLTDPTLVDYQPGGSGANTKMYEFAKDDIAYFTTQLPHNYKVGSDIYVHLHWTPREYGVAQSGRTVGWKVQYSIASINGVFPAMTTADLSDTCSGTNHKHEITNDVLISGSTFNISSVIIAQVTRTDTGGDDTWGETLSGRLPLLASIDFHYEIDTMGSREKSSK